MAFVLTNISKYYIILLTKYCLNFIIYIQKLIKDI